jgi:hypothetical protein
MPRQRRQAQLPETDYMCGNRNEKKPGKASCFQVVEHLFYHEVIPILDRIVLAAGGRRNANGYANPSKRSALPPRICCF